MKNLVAPDFKLVSCQATIFTPDEELSPLKLIRTLLPKWLGLFDGEPLVLPRKPQTKPTQLALKEVPVVVLQSARGEWRCEMFDARVNVIWSALVGQVESSSVAHLLETAREHLGDYIDRLQVRVGRMAVVTSRYAEHPSPGLFLARHFCQDRWESAPLNRPEGFELHSHKRFSLGSKFVVNSWVRSRTATIGDPPEPIVAVEQDLNTLSEEAGSRRFGKDDLAEFLSLAAREFETILSLYYPGVKT